MKNDKNPDTEKPMYKRVWFWSFFLIIFIAVGISLANNKASSNSSNNDSSSEYSDANDYDDDTTLSSPSISSSSTESASESSSSSSKPATDDFSSVSKTYNLSAGNYAIGVDIPVGTANITATAGQGNLMTAEGSLNEMFGIDDGTGSYTANYSNAELKKGDVLELNGELKITLTYSDVKSNINPWTYNDVAPKQLGDGTYTAGTDFPAGVYKITAISGQGNLSDDTNINEMFGIDDGSGDYNNQFNGAVLNAGDKLKVDGGLTVNIVPANNK